MDKAHKDLAEHRLKQAEQCLTSAQVLIDIKDYDGASNRVYYAVFHANQSKSLLCKTNMLFAVDTECRNVFSVFCLSG